MKVITGTRGCGVSAQLTLDALLSPKAMYICATRARADTLKDTRNFQYIKFVTLDDIANGKFMGVDADIYVDDVQHCLESFLHSHGVYGEIKGIGATW